MHGSTHRELRHIVANLGAKIEEEELDEVMKEADPDGSGQTDYKAFTTLMFKPV